MAAVLRKTDDLLIDTPLLEKLERLAIHWQKSLPGLVGGHNTSHFSGAGQEFLDHRNFHHGDDLRSVNWRAYLRLDKLFMKMFHLEPRVPVRILVDVSQSMITGNPTKFDYARKLAGAMAYVGLVRLDSICLQPFSERLGDPLTISGGRQRFQPALNYLSSLTPGGKTDFLKIARDFIARYPQRGLVVIVSDFLDDADPEKPIQYLADFGHDIILIQVWGEEDREPPWEGEMDLEDAESGTRLQLAFDEPARQNYVEAFDRYAAHLREVALRNNGRYAGLPTSIAVEEALFGPLVKMGVVE